MFLVGLFIVPSAKFIFFASDSLNCAASIVRARYYTNQIQSDCFEYTLKFLFKSSQQLMPKYISYIVQIFLSLKKTHMKNFQTKKKSLYHLPSPISLTLPSPPPPFPQDGPRVKLYCLRCSFLLLVVVRHFSHFLCLSLFLSVWKYPNALCNSIPI